MYCLYMIQSGLVSLMSMLVLFPNSGILTPPDLYHRLDHLQFPNTIHAVLILYRNENDATNAPDASF